MIRPVSFSLRTFSSLSLAIALVLALPASAGDADDPSIAAFAALKKDVETLRKDSERKQFRHNFEKLIVRLQGVANAHRSPSGGEGSKADDAAFVAAQLLEELYFVSRLASDKSAAVDAFTSCAERFSDSNLADDALLAAARLTDDPAKARAALERVVAMKDADLRDEAKRQLAALKSAPPSTSPAAAIASTSAPPALSADAQAALAKLAPAPASPTPTAAPKGPTASAPVVPVTTVTPKIAPVMVLPEPPPPGTPSRKVVVIRHEKVSGESIVTLRMSGDVGVTRGEVPVAEGGVRRIFFDLAPARLGSRNIQPIDVHDGVVARVRAGQYDTEVVRMVVELEGDVEPVLKVSKKPFEVRLVTTMEPPPVDVIAGAPGTPVGPLAKREKHEEPPPAKVIKEKLGNGKVGGVSISQQLGLAVHRVVIDAGHGGTDSGAVGPSGVKEKDITLQIAKRVQQKLLGEFPDVEVIMTRDGDDTLALQDRTNTANSVSADLFISIHCNASPYKRVRGVETYTLNITHDRYAMKLAARENAEMGEGSISDLEFILADLAMKSNVDDSVRLGRAVQKSIMKNLKKRWSDVPDLGLKHALFYVLMGNHMPSILVETSFLSNKMEEQRLASAAYQDSIAEGILEGVRTFIEERQAFLVQP